MRFVWKMFFSNLHSMASFSLSFPARMKPQWSDAANFGKKCGELPIKYFLVLKIGPTATQTHQAINTLWNTHLFRAQIIQQGDYTRTLQQRFHENKSLTGHKVQTLLTHVFFPGTTSLTWICIPPIAHFAPIGTLWKLRAVTKTTHMATLKNVPHKIQKQIAVFIRFKD